MASAVGMLVACDAYSRIDMITRSLAPGRPVAGTVAALARVHGACGVSVSFKGSSAGCKWLAGAICECRSHLGEQSAATSALVVPSGLIKLTS
eukprot:scaffold3491_cov17-Prasinocladus_malaysianus.AAC.1